MTDTTAGAAAGVPAAGRSPARGVLLAYRWVLTLFLVAGAVQFFLAGLGVWGGGIGPHRMLGFVLAGATVLVVVLALLTRAGLRDVVLSVVLLLLAGGGQSLFAGLAQRGSAVWGGLHALDGLVILGLAGLLQGAAIRRSRTGA